jgi:hypothetical protein
MYAVIGGWVRLRSLLRCQRGGGVWLFFIRVYTHPPDTVVMVVSAICILLQEKTTSWAVARQVMSDQHFLKRLINIDKDAIPEQVCPRIGYLICQCLLIYCC